MSDENAIIRAVIRRCRHILKETLPVSHERFTVNCNKGSPWGKYIEIHDTIRDIKLYLTIDQDMPTCCFYYLYCWMKQNYGITVIIPMEYICEMIQSAASRY